MLQNPHAIAFVFTVVTFLLSGVSLVSLFMMLPNDLQSRITMKDRSGWGITAIGLMLGMFALLLAGKLFTPSIGIYDLSSYFAQIFAMFAGAMVFMGITIVLPDRLTDSFLDSKNVIWLYLFAAVVIVLLLLFVK